MQQPIQQAMPQGMQQQQQEQLAAQQLQQQMMLCPVRVVYETQILVQPGDQIQPNQTLFINPQNPPPWAQNRQMQNPVIYVQQMPNNIMPTVPQHIDQNQLYLQQYQNYQQMIPQQILGQEQRVQLSNIIPQNMIQNYQTNMSPNISNLPDRISQNYSHMQNIAPGMQMQVQQQLNIVNNIKREPNMQIVQASQPAQHNNQRVELKPAMHMNVMPQVASQLNQQQIRPSPQVLTVNPIQNIPQTNANVQTMPTNIVPRQIQTHSVGSQMSPPTFANATNGQQLPRIRKVAPTTVNKVTNTNVTVRGVGQTYRPIQPRPQQFRSNTPYQNQTTVNMPHQHRPTAPPTPSLPNPMNVNTSNPMNVNTSLSNVMNVHSTLPSNTIVNTTPTNVINVNSTLPSMPSLHMPILSAPYTKPEENKNIRKRKSESPDEIHKKMAAIQVNITTPIKPVMVPQRSVEIGVNTVSMQRVEQKPAVTVVPKPLQSNNAETQAAELKQITKLVENVQQAIQIDKSNIKTSSESKDTSSTDNDKLIRNTVYTQARGRVLTDKEILNVVDSNVLKQEKSPEIQPAIPEVKVEIKNESQNVQTTLPVPEVKKVDKRDMHDASVSLNTANNKGMLPVVDRKFKQDKDFLLTHVLDGIVIQESNVAFPIREPVTRRFVQQLAQTTEKKIVLEETEVKPKEEVKPDTSSKDMPKLITEPKEEHQTTVYDNEQSNEDDNPFTSLQHITVKSWTTEELSAHLSKLRWAETASLFLEHEIDGESLFLVSKTQLLTIGVKDNHAEVICNFVKS